MGKWISVLLGTACWTCTINASATETLPEDDRQIYERTYFDRFTPQNARDMVSRIPGFSIDGGNNARGFGGTAGNVLIDGERPTSKSGGIWDALSRISADNVVRIELIRGTAGAGESAGQAVIANVVRKEGGQSGTWLVQGETIYGRPVMPRVQATFETPVGEWSTSSKIHLFSEKFKNPQFQIFRDENGDITQGERETNPASFYRGVISGEASRSVGKGKLTLSGEFSYNQFDRDINRLKFDGRLPDTGGAPETRSLFDLGNHRFAGELSGTYSRDHENDWSSKILTLVSARHFERENTVIDEDPIGTPDFTSISERESKPMEVIARATLSKGGSHTFKPEFGGEIAYNRLDASNALTEIDAAGIVTNVELEAANVLVEETRGEVFSNLIWSMAPKWTLETGFAVEASEITVSGDTENSQTFVYPKPFATLIYDLDDDIQFRAGIRRNVGQLNFNDFAASVNVTDDRVLGGNPNLEPEKDTTVSMSVDYRNGEAFALNVEGFYEWRSDVLEQIKLDSGAFGLGNAGDAEYYGVEVTTTLSLDRFIPGGQIEAEGEWYDSSFDDPLIGETRSLNNVFSPQIEIDFRQDVTDHKFAWGFGWETYGTAERFFVNEASLLDEDARFDMFIETTRFKGLKIGFYTGRPTKQRLTRERTLFSDDDTRTVIGTEYRSREIGPYYTLRVEGQF